MALRTNFAMKARRREARREARREQRRATRLDRTGDAGFTLPEVLIAMTVGSLLVASLGFAFSVVARGQTGSQSRITESKDITFVQTWLPADLSSATRTWLEPQLEFPFAAQENGTVLGTNVLTMSRPDLATGNEYLIMYRYEEISGRGWALVRYRVDNPGCPTASPVVGDCSLGAESVKRIGVAYELPAPPDTWDISQPPSHAVEVTRRNGGATYGSGTEGRPVGEDVTVNFNSGSIYIAGGTGLSAGQIIDPNPEVIPDPVAPPSRCGRRIQLIIDQSGSVHNQGLDDELRAAATSFVQGFRGTPGSMSVVGFDGWVEPLPNDPGVYFDLLNDDASALNLINTVFPGMILGGAYSWNPNVPATNWEVALMSSYAVPNDWEEISRTYDGGDEDRTELEYHDVVPEMVVFITDGLPNYVLDDNFNYASSDRSTATGQAAGVANIAREFGVQEIVGVLVGDTSSSYVEEAVESIRAVVGGTEWDGALPGNAAVANYFAADFDELGPILEEINRRECGGAITIQKRFNDSTSPSTTGVWDFQSPQGNKVLDHGSSSSVTFQHAFQTGETSKEFWIEEQIRDGWVVDRMECESRGAAIAAGRIVRDEPDTSTGDDRPVRFNIDLQPDEALSCFIFSDREV